MIKVLRSKKGVTLIEILLAVAILAVASLPLMSFIPSTAKVTYNTQEELQMNQELRSVILKITDVIKDKDKALDIAGGGSKTIDQIITVDKGSFTSNDYFKIPNSSNSFKINGEKTINTPVTTNNGKAVVYVSNELPTGTDVANAPTHRFSLIFLNTSDTQTFLINKLKFRYEMNVTLKHHPFLVDEFYDNLSGTDSYGILRLPIELADVVQLPRLGGTNHGYGYQYDFSRYNDETMNAGEPPNKDIPHNKIKIAFNTQPPVTKSRTYTDSITSAPITKDYTVNSYYEVSFEDLDVSYKLLPKHYLQIHPVIQPEHSFDLTNDFSFMPKNYSNVIPDPLYISNTGEGINPYYKWDGQTVTYDGTDLIGGGSTTTSSYGYETDLYTINIELYNSKDRVVKKAKVVISGDED